MVIQHKIEGYESFLNFIENVKSEYPVHILYSGTKLPNGKSWCPDCVEAEPFIEEGIQAAPEQSHFVYVEVGDRAYWKDPKCPFRTDAKTKLKVLPTLVKWGTQKRLEGNQCLNVDLIKMLVTDTDDD